MKKTFLKIFLFALFFSACGASPAAPTAQPASPTPPPPSPSATPTEITPPTVTPACMPAAPTESDIQRALNYTGQILPEPYWQKTYTVQDSYVAVTQQNENGALAYLEARIKPCGYDEPDLNKEFNDENWRAIFANYNSYEKISECRNELGLRLYEFNASFADISYAISYWVQSDTDHRIITLMLVFPAQEFAVMSAYAARLFPELPNCS